MGFEDAQKIFVRAVTAGAIVAGVNRGTSWVTSIVVNAHFVSALALAPSEEEKDDGVEEVLCSRASDYLAYQTGQTGVPDWLKENWIKG